jgi:hypothetical protein
MTSSLRPHPNAQSRKFLQTSIHRRCCSPRLDLRSNRVSGPCSTSTLSTGHLRALSEGGETDGEEADEDEKSDLESDFGIKEIRPRSREE